MTTYILALDQGTTSTRAILFDADARPVAISQREFAQHYPRSGWVEHEAEDIWNTSVETIREVLARKGAQAKDIAALGITNQRETTLVWDRKTGKAIHRAIVWQDRRTAEACEALRRAGGEARIAGKTGLLLDPYFSATKAAWILDHVDGARARAEAGDLAFGTVDSFLLWRLTGGRVHATDATNASRTLLFNIHAGQWDDELCEMFRVPRAMLPLAQDCSGSFGETDASLFGTSIKVCGIAGDQQAATVGQACFQPGMLKATYGTGCFCLLNTGGEAVTSRNRLLTTIAYQLGGKRTYALEGSIFIAGAAVQWLRDGLKIIGAASESGLLAAEADPEQDVYLVPAFAGLGAPYWDADCRGALYGLTRGTTRKELARAALEAVCFQTRDLIEAMASDWGGSGRNVLRADGGLAASDWTMQRLADILDAPVDRPQVIETTAIGAAYLAGLAAGVYPDLDGFSTAWALERRFTPTIPADLREKKYAGWKDAVRRTLSAAT
ncbi:MAG: glycerol kinase GlpK [Parvibaculaceae bacterium]